MKQFVRGVAMSSVLGLLMVLWPATGALSASAQEDSPTNPPESAPTPPSDEVVQALVVGGTAFAIMVAAACAVLFYTARRRGHADHG
ncbi:hypothetical protein [Saccharomonospora saliphila]|uniref:hypothetical protein n=1 Tax=Saccharomonospora saliphila TaxID=369829 RepID=UPI000365166B|nr:hypothetical protein [Saccharomonospora saliphila]